MAVTTHIIGALAGIALGLGAVLPMTQRALPLDVVDYSLVHDTVEQGGSLLVHIALNYTRPNCAMTTDSTLFYGPRPGQEDSREPLTNSGSGQTGEREFVRTYRIDPSALLGDGRLSTSFSFRCDWTDSILGPRPLQLPDLHFTVTPPTGRIGEE